MQFTPDEQTMRAQRREKIVHEAALLQEMCKHPGFQILQRLINEKIQDNKNLWLRADTQEKCWEIKLRTQPWQEIFDMIFKKIALGHAADLLARNNSEGSAKAE